MERFNEKIKKLSGSHLITLRTNKEVEIKEIDLEILDRVRKS